MGKRDWIIVGIVFFCNVVATSVLVGMLWRSEEVHRLEDRLQLQNNTIAQTQLYLSQFDFNEDAGEAIFRRVAIIEGEQRKGYGTKLMRMAEDFALGRSCSEFIANVALDAVPFYQNLAYVLDEESEQRDAANPRMVKRVG